MPRKSTDILAAATSGPSLEAQAAPDPRRPAGPAITAEIGVVRTGLAEELERTKKRLADAEAKLATTGEGREVIFEVEPDRLVDSRFRDRDQRSLSPAEIEPLARDIEAKGQVVEVEVRPSKEHPDKYEIVYGHRRVRACRLLNRKVRVKVHEADDLEAVRRMEVENTKRLNLSPIERAKHYKALIDAGLMTQAQIAREFGWSRGQVSQLVSLNDIPDVVLDALGDARKMTQMQGVRLAHALRDPGLRERGVREAPHVKASGLPLERRLAFFRDPDARISTDEAAAEARRAEHRDASGRLVAALTRHGKNPVIRFEPDVDRRLVEFVWARLPSLKAQFEGDERG